MSKICKLVILFACISAVLYAIPRDSYFLNPKSELMPKIRIPALRETVPNNLIIEDYSTSMDAWQYRETLSAVYNDQGQIIRFDDLVWDGFNEEWSLMASFSFEYRPDGRPLSGILEGYQNGTAVQMGRVVYDYEGNLMKAIKYEMLQNGNFSPYYYKYFLYFPNTNILNRTMEMFWVSEPPMVYVYAYNWYCGNQPVEIKESQVNYMEVFEKTSRDTYVYHELDQTSHAEYMRYLEFGWPYVTHFATGFRPTKPLEKRVYSYSIFGEDEFLRYFYEYDEAGVMQRIKGYEGWGASPFVQNLEWEFGYENGLPITETWYDVLPNRTELRPRTKLTMEYTTLTSTDDPVNPALIQTLKVHPNPFSHSTGIHFKLKTSSPTEVAVYNLKGQKVRSILKTEKSAGDHDCTWDGKDDSGKKAASGIYVIKLISGSETQSVKTILMKK